MWMTRNLVVISPYTLIVEAAALMAQNHIRRLPVVEKRDGSHYPVGIITATDILHVYPPEVNPFAVMPRDISEAHMTAAQVMSRTLQTIEPETPLEEAARLMRNAKISTLLVVQKAKLVGLITESDIFRAFVGIFEPTFGNVRITFEIESEEDTFGFIAPFALRWGVRVVSLLSISQGDRQLCVIRLAGDVGDELLAELWRSGHRVLNVLRLT